MAAETALNPRASRPYQLGRRQTAVEEKRAKIVEAARDLIMSERALAGFSVEAVAKQAKVARATIYNRFGNRLGLLEALFDDLAQRGGMLELEVVFREDSPHDSLKLFIAAFGRFWTNDRVLIRRLHAMITLDPEMAVADAARQERRRKGLQTIVGRLNEQHRLTADKPLSKTIETIHALTSFETFDALAGTTRSPLEVVPVVQKLAFEVLRLNEP